MIGKKTGAVLAGGALTVSTAVAGMALTSTADAASRQHTMKFTAVSDRGLQAGHNAFVGTEIDKKHGERVGFDLLSGRFNRQTQHVIIRVAVARNGGMLLCRVHDTSRTDYRGMVTGGTGRFKGASGTITAHNVPGTQGNKTRVTIHYTL